MITTLLRLLVGEWLADPALLFLAAVALIAWRAGPGPGCLAVALSALAQARYLIAPDHYLLATLAQGVALAIWSAEGVLMCALFGALHAAKARVVVTVDALARNQTLLRDREERLRSAHENLEREVDARTLQLARANDDLRRETVHREQVSEQLRQAQKMEAIGRLAGGVAHDFNNVLSVVLTLTALNIEDLEPGTRIYEDLDEIRKAGQRAADLTRQLLTFSRQQVVEARVLNVHDVLADMDKMLRHLVGEDVSLVVPTARPAGSVRIDAGSLGQVVMNLAVNARDAMPTGGRLEIGLADIVLDASYARSHVDAKAGPHVVLTVSDTGQGMDKVTLARIFEPFFTTKEKGKGTGLGLATVFGVVQQAGGSISVSSEQGAGTTFRIYLPRADAALDGAQPTMSAVVSLRGDETILLAEDEEQVRAAAHGILRRYGYRVLEARGGDDALRVCEQYVGAIHLVLSDVVMPGMGGPALAGRLAATRPEIKVLCMSGYTDESVVGPSGLGPGVAFIQKPFEPEMLARKLREVLDSTLRIQ